MSVNHSIGFVKCQARSTDAFLGGKLSIAQPLKGFRAGLDSVLLGASVSPSSTSLLDLGAGAGVAAFSAMAHNGRLDATLLEIDPEMAACARENAATNGLAERTRIIELDAGAAASDRRAAGLAANGFSSVIANPPFFAAGRGTPPLDDGRAGARHIEEEALAGWVRTAAACVAARGEVIFVHTVQALPGLLSAFSGRFGDIAVLPLVPRSGMAASRVLVRGVRDTRAPLTLLSPLVLHGQTGNGFRPEIDAVLRGKARLDWHSGASMPK